MSVIDASVWVSRFLPDDAYHAASSRWVKQVSGAGGLLVSPASMMAEVAGAIARRTGDRHLGYQIIQQIRRIPTLQIVAIDDSLGMYSAQLASDLHIRGADALYIATASRLQLPLITWDREQLDRARALIGVQTPEEVR